MGMPSPMPRGCIPMLWRVRRALAQGHTAHGPGTQDRSRGTRTCASAPGTREQKSSGRTSQADEEEPDSERGTRRSDKTAVASPNVPE